MSRGRGQLCAALVAAASGALSGAAATVFDPIATAFLTIEPHASFTLHR